jgi:hypothetical protein
MRHENLTGTLIMLGGLVAVIGLLAALCLLMKGVQLMGSQYGEDTGIYFVLGAFAIGALFGLLGAIGIGVAALFRTDEGPVHWSRCRNWTQWRLHRILSRGTRVKVQLRNEGKRSCSVEIRTEA